MNAAESSLGIDIDGVEGKSPFGGPVSVVVGNVDGGGADFMIVFAGQPDILTTDSSSKRTNSTGSEAPPELRLRGAFVRTVVMAGARRYCTVGARHWRPACVAPAARAERQEHEASSPVRTSRAGPFHAGFRAGSCGRADVRRNCLRA